MGGQPDLVHFYAAIVEDARIGATHISVYMALFYLWQLNGFVNPIRVTSKEVMRLAKIGGAATYHRCIKDLVEGGYIGYVASFNPAVGSEVFIRSPA